MAPGLASFRKGVLPPAAALCLGAALAGCGRGAAPALDKSEEETDGAVPDVPPPSPDGPRLGAIANLAPVLDRPSRRGTLLGYLHAGGTVARSTLPYSVQGCEGGWYPVHPAGLVCAGATATRDLAHPTLAVMAIQPDLGKALPYAYARTIRDSSLYRVAKDRDDRVEASEPVPARSGLAIVGSFAAAATSSPSEPLRLAMTTDGRFVPTADLEALEPSPFHGIALTDGHELPVAFVVKRGVRSWTLRGDEPEKGDLLPYHAALELTGRSRDVNGVGFLAAKDGLWVRERDVTAVLARHELPAFAHGDQKWIDVSVVTGAAVLYEGKRPVFVTLASVGAGRLGSESGPPVTLRGEFDVVAKHVTFVGRDPGTFTDGAATYDVPWVLELSSGQLVVGAYWHDRFGIEHGPGNLELSPSDAARLFAWADPPLPAGWHGVRARAGRAKTIVNVRK